MQVRRFSPDVKSKAPGGHPGMYGVPIHTDVALAPQSAEEREKWISYINGLPIILNRRLIIAALYFEQHGSMDEHSSDVPCVFLVISGKGFIRVGGPEGETRAVTAGDAVLWPAGLDHKVWTEDEELWGIVVDGPPERESA